MSDSIKLSPKYGVNPTIPICFFCGESKNEIALLGRVWERDSNGKKVRGSDIEAPKGVVLDYEPCDKCKQKLEEENKVYLVEVTKFPEDHRPPIQDDVYPTGRYAMLSREAFRVPVEKPLMLITEDDFNELFGNN